jgi:ketosteroid isomerase-like protein
VEVELTTDGQLAFAHYIVHVSGTNRNGQQDEFKYRVTDCSQKVEGKRLT